MRGRDHRSIALAAAALLAVASGCTMCPDPFDYTGPVPNGSAPQNDFRARSNGILPIGAAPQPWPPVVKASAPQPASPAGPVDGDPDVVATAAVRLSADRPATAEADPQDDVEDAAPETVGPPIADPVDASTAEDTTEPVADSGDTPAEDGTEVVPATAVTPAEIPSGAEAEEARTDAHDVTVTPPPTAAPLPAPPRETPGWRSRR